MRLLPILSSLLFATLSLADENPISFPLGDAQVAANTQLTITWQPTTQGKVSLTLRNGKTDNLAPGIALDSTTSHYLPTRQPIALLTIFLAVDNTGSYTYNVPSDIVNGMWTIEIRDGADPPHFNYSPLFTVTGGTGKSSELTTPKATPTPGSPKNTDSSATTTAASGSSASASAAGSASGAAATGAASRMGVNGVVAAGLGVVAAMV